MHFTERPRPRHVGKLTWGLAMAALAASLTSYFADSPALAKSRGVPYRLMEASLRETQAALDAGTVTSEDLVKMYLARIEAFDKNGPMLNSVIRINENALDEARARDAGRRRRHTRGPLYGIPVLLKDNYDTFDMATSASSLSLASSVPPDDAFLVKKLREAGAVFLGKTNMHEFAYGITTISSLGGQTLNPYDPTRNPGGSSGGTGAAIAANFAVFGMGSDTCGSIRIPSSHNSLVGLRATQGLFSRDGIIPLALTQDMGGPLARSVEDIAIVLDAIAGFDPNDPVTEVSRANTPASYTHFLKTGRLRGARFGLLLDALVTVPEDQEVADVILAARQELEDKGATVVDVSIPDYTTVSNVSVISMEFNSNLNQYLSATPNAPVKTLQEVVDSGLFHPSLLANLTGALAFPTPDSSPDYRVRLAGRETFKEAILKVMSDNNLDALIYPTIRQKPVLVPSTAQPGSNCRVSAQSSLPAISVPVGFTADGIPVGMEFLGRAFTEGQLLQFAYSWEQATHHRREPASTPDLDPRWTHTVSDGVASFFLNGNRKLLRFVGPDLDTHVYIDPDMRIDSRRDGDGQDARDGGPVTEAADKERTKGRTISGQIRDDRWRIKYFVPLSDSRVATVWVEDSWTDQQYTLYGWPDR